MKIRASSIIYLLLIISVLSRMLLSNPLLDSWYPYAEIGGAWFQKIHPGTIVAIVALIFVLILPLSHVRKIIWKHERAALLYLASVTFACAISIVQYGTSGVAYLVDTFFVAGCYAVLARLLSGDQREKILNFILLIVALNSALALAEYGLARNFLPHPANFDFFRSTALFGHPLNNALMTVVALFAVLGIKWPLLGRVSYISLMLLSLFAFGARGAMLVAAIGIAGFLLVQSKYIDYSSKGKTIVFTLSVMMIVVSFSAIAAVLYFTELGNSIVIRLVPDESILARWNSLQLLKAFTAEEYILGVDPATLDYLSFHAGVPIIENFWIVLALRLGLPTFALVVFATFFMLRAAIRRASWTSVLGTLAFIGVASTNNSLATKSFSLALLVLTISMMATSAHCKQTFRKK